MAKETIEELTKKLETREFMWAEMSPDLYDGEDCDQVCPLWHVQCEGDMDSERAGIRPTREEITIGNKVSDQEFIERIGLAGLMNRRMHD